MTHEPGAPAPTFTGLDESAIIAWQDATFPNADVTSVFLHLREEFDELADAIDFGRSSEAQDELGDVALLLVSLANKLGASLSQCAMTKFATASQRRYRYDDALGYAKHVRDDEA